MLAEGDSEELIIILFYMFKSRDMAHKRQIQIKLWEMKTNR